ncbi:MAG TPA: hypothetical protein VKE74_04890 [Gemmataceae bacterium]|nr:hypothetical protein [Gemmataceae bacterium]
MLLLLGGTATLGWYWFGYETTIVVNDPLRGPVAVQDLGRVSQHLAGMIGGGTLAVLGVMLVLRRPPA